MTPPTSLTFIQTFALILDDLCRAVAARGGRDRTVTPLVVLLHTRLRRLTARFTALLARIAAGTLPAPAAPRPGRKRCAPPTPRPRLPEGYAWVLAFVWETRGYASQLNHLLSQPEAVALLATTPQAGRVLRPLCRMLGIELPPGNPPPPPANPLPDEPRPSDPAAPAEGGKQPMPGPPLIPTPRFVVTA